MAAVGVWRGVVLPKLSAMEPERLIMQEFLARHYLMSSSNPRDAPAAPDTAAPTDTHELEQYLQEKLDAHGSFYTKSAEMAEDLPFSPQQIGRRLPHVNTRDNNIQIEKAGRTDAITWYISETP